MYESFYGGKQGRSFHIVERYDSVYEMVSKFQEGTNYTDVAFDEYVLIDTILNNNQKSNPENGLLYRRGYNYQESFYFNDAEQRTLDREELISVTLPIITLNEKYTYNWSEDALDVNPDEVLGYQEVLAPAYYNFEYTFIASETEEIEPGEGSEETPGEGSEESGEDSGTTIIQYPVVVTKTSFNNDRWSTAWSSYVTNPGGGAIYVGQIVGTTGETPIIQLISWEEFQEATANNTEQYQHNFTINPIPGHVDLSNEEDITDYLNLGYDADGYRDTMKYGYCTYRDEQGNITGLYLALDIPYTVFNFEAQGISAYPPQSIDSETGVILKDYTDPITGVVYHYNDFTNLWEYDNLVSENIDSQEHPFYKHYDIKIPKGVHGQNVNDFKIRFFDQNNHIYQDVYKYDDQNKIIGYADGVVVPIDDYGHTGFNHFFGNQFLTYQTTNYDQTEAGEVSEIQPIAPYKIIVDLDTTQRQTTTSTGNYAHNYPNKLIVNYTHGDPTIIDYSIVERIWIQPMDSETQYGIDYTTSHEDANNVNYNGLHLLRKSHLYILYSNEMRPRDLGLINFAENLWVQEENNINIVDTNGNILTQNHLYIQMSGDTSPTDIGLIKKLDDIWIQSTTDNAHEITRTINNDGDLVKEDYIYAQLTNEEYPHELGFIRKIVGIEKDLTDQNFYVHYNYDVNGQTSDNIRELLPINEIDAIDFVGDLFLIHFKNLEIPSTFQQAYVRDDGSVWLNLGTVVKGNHVWTNFNTYEDLINEYPDGLDNAEDISVINRAGWLVTVGHDIDVLIDTNTHQSINSLIAFIQYDELQGKNVVTLPEDSTAILTYDNESEIYTITFTEPILVEGSESGEGEESGEGSESESGEGEGSEPIYIIPDPIQCQIEEAVGYKLYGFDYRQHLWYAIQDMAAGAVKPEYSILVAPATQYNLPDHIDANQLNANGIWFIEVAQ